MPIIVSEIKIAPGEPKEKAFEKAFRIVSFSRFEAIAATNSLLFLSTKVTAQPLPTPPYTVSPSKSPKRLFASTTCGRSCIVWIGWIVAQLFLSFVVFLPRLRRCVFRLMPIKRFSFKARYMVEVQILNPESLHLFAMISGDQYLLKHSIMYSYRSVSG